MKTSRLFAFAFALALLAACATTPNIPTPLSSRTRARLANAAQPPDRLDIRLQQGEGGEVALLDVRKVTLGPTVTLPLETGPAGRRYLPVVRIRLNNQPAFALLDTGSAASLVDYPTAKQSALTPLRYGRPRPGADPAEQLLVLHHSSRAGYIRQYIAIAPAVGLGHINIYNVPFGVLDDTRRLDQVLSLPGMPAGAVLGNDILSLFDNVTLDFPAGTLRIGSGRYRPDPQKLAAAVPMVGDSATLSMQAQVGDKEPSMIIIDTSADIGLQLPQETADQLDQNPSQGTVADQVVNIAGYELGPVPTVVSARGGVDGEPDLPVLGNRALRAYAVTIDRKAGKIYFEKN